MLEKIDYDLVQQDVLSKKMVVKRQIHSNEQLDLTAFRYPIEIPGDIGEGTKIKASSRLTISGNIGKDCQIETQGSVVAENLGSNTSIQAGQDIAVKNIGDRCVLSALNGRINTKNIEENSVITAKHTVIAENVAANVLITSTAGQVFLGCVGEHAKINAALDITFRTITATTELITPKTIYKKIGNSGASTVYVPTPVVSAAENDGISLSLQTLSGNSSVQVTGTRLSSLSISIKALNTGYVQTLHAQPKQSTDNIDANLTADDGVRISINGSERK